MIPTDSAEAQARDRAATEVAAVLCTVEHALDRARQAQAVVAKDGVNRNAELALAAAILALDRVRNGPLQVTR